MAHSRIAFDTTGKKEMLSVWKGLREACTDYRMWLFALMANLHLSSNGFKNFLPTVVQVSHGTRLGVPWSIDGDKY